MSKIAYVNGAYLPQSEACVNIEDRGYQFGDGIYEVVHVHRGRFVDEDRHLGRLERSLKEIRLPMPMPRAALRLVLREVLRRNRITADGLVYMQVTRGVAPRDHAFPRKSVPVSCIVTAKRIPPYPTDLDATTISAITQPDLRWARCDIKTVNLLPNVLARQAAREAGAAEAILYDETTGMVRECAATSFWIVDAGGVLRTRQLDHHILPGCTRGALIAELEAAGIPHTTEEFSLETMRSAREAFLTSATSFVKPITKIDGTNVADGKVGPVTRRLFEIFTRHVQASAGNV
jgi:D-alanine transaminase